MTAPQFDVDEPPRVIDEGDALNDEMTGVPLHPTGNGGGGNVRVGVGVDVRVGGTTLMVSVRWTFCLSSVTTRKVWVVA